MLLCAALTQHIVLEIVFEGYYQVCFSPTEQAVHFGVTAYMAGYAKIFARVDSLGDAQGGYILRRVEHRYPDTFYLGGDGETEQDDLYHRNTYHNEHSAHIPQDMQELLVNER